MMDVSSSEALQLKENLFQFLNDAEKSAEKLEGIYKDFSSLRLFKLFKDSNGNIFKDMSTFCEAPIPFGLAKSQIEIREIIEHRFQREKERVQFAANQTNSEDPISPGRYSSKIYGKDRILEERAIKNQISKRTQIKLDKLARQYPDLHQQVKMGLMSANEAMIEAGLEQRLIQFPIGDPLKTASKIKEYYSSEQVQRLVEFLLDSKVKKTSEVNKIYESGEKIKL